MEGIPNPGKRTFQGENKDSQKLQPEILGDWDKRVLEEGIGNVVVRMFSDFGSRLPDIVVFPDTSARPLLYALKPIFHRISEEKHIEKPDFYFLNTRTPNRIQDTAEKVMEKDMETKDELRAYMDMMDEGRREFDIHYNSESDRRMILEVDRRIRANDDETVSADPPEKMQEARDLMRKRAQEILAYGKRNGNQEPAVAVVDEFVSMLGNTAREIRRAFEREDLPIYPYMPSLPELNLLKMCSQEYRLVRQKKNGEKTNYASIMPRLQQWE